MVCVFRGILKKSLLAMFSIKGKHYKMEYEGYHPLCLFCGRFRHETSRCMAKDKCDVEMGNKESGCMQVNG